VARPALIIWVSKGGQEGALVVVGQAVGVVGEGGFLGQDRQSGEQGAAEVAQQVIDVGDAAGGGQFQGQQGQDAADRRDRGGAGVAGGRHQGGQVQGDQVGDDQQQPGEPGVEPFGQGGEVDDGGAGEGRVPAGGGRRGAGLAGGRAVEPAEALLGEDRADAGPVQRDALGRQGGADLVHRLALAAQFDDAGAGGVLPGCVPWAGLAGRDEQVKVAGAEAAVQAGHRPPGVAELLPGLGQGQPVNVVGAQRLIAALAHLLRGGEKLTARLR
jgi:hypothetical protein